MKVLAVGMWLQVALCRYQRQDPRCISQGTPPMVQLPWFEEHQQSAPSSLQYAAGLIWEGAMDALETTVRLAGKMEKSEVQSVAADIWRYSTGALGPLQFRLSSPMVASDEQL